MKWSLIAVTLTSLFCPPVMAAVNIYGPGGMTCARYTQSPDSDKDDFKYWGLGYISGINSMKNLDIVRGKDQASMFQWIDNYCKSNPQSTYNGAVDSLIIEINKLQVPSS
ncbi:MAG: hypothetical protein K8R69_10395 [Deltaproteobacteria bacterium]|nr:hypothetical protein [Deltaproteobacteria bacterium]